MPALHPDCALRFVAFEGPYLYDVHSLRFAELEHGATAATGFAPLYVSALFGVPVSEWPEWTARACRTLSELEPSLRSAWVRKHGQPARSPMVAAEMALLAYPSMERYLVRCTGRQAPFRLLDEYLYQPNVSLQGLQARRPDGSWVDVARASDHLEREAIRAGLQAGADGSDHPNDGSGMLATLAQLECLGDRAPIASSRPPPGVYALGHSSLLVCGSESSLLVDPLPLAQTGRGPDRIPITWLKGLADAIALTHSHFDHYHLPSIIALGDRTVVVPSVPRASIVCEDMAARLRSFGLRDVRTPSWNTSLNLGDITLHVLPFYGEQFLTSEEWPQARNWGNAYIVETANTRVLIAADCGFEKDRSLFDVVEQWVSEHGCIDVVAAQSIGLSTAFAQGDPDLQITALTCPHRAVEAVELLRPERRVTLAPRDVPVLCERAGAGWFVPYGQFQFAVGGPIVGPDTMASVQGAFDATGVEHPVWIVGLDVGQGLRFDDLGARVSLTDQIAGRNAHG